MSTFVIEEILSQETLNALIVLEGALICDEHVAYTDMVVFGHQRLESGEMQCPCCMDIFVPRTENQFFCVTCFNELSNREMLLDDDLPF